MWVVLLVTLGFGAIGWVDDYRKVVLQAIRRACRRATKFFWQSVIGIVAAVYLAFSVSAPTNTKVWELFIAWVQSASSSTCRRKADLIVPFFKTISYPLGVWGFIALTYFVIVGTSNAVNLTDGLDGLAIMPTVMVGCALGMFAYADRQRAYLEISGLSAYPGAGELLVFCGAMAGAGLAFLWFNAYPAEVFMGDVGALALGGALGTIAVIVRQEIVLFIMGGVFVVETLSVMIQVAYFKLPRTRQARVSHGAAASPLRIEGLEGNAGRGAVLDHHDDAGAVRPVDVEAALGWNAMQTTANSVLVLGLGESGLAMARWLRAAARACAWPIRAPRRRACRALRDVLPRCGFVAGPFDAGAARRRRLRRGQPGPGAGRELRRSSPPRANAAFRCGGEIELFAQALAALAHERGYAPKVIAITGTNGKTTVTALAGRCASAAGLRPWRRRQHQPGGAGRAARRAGATLRCREVWVLELVELPAGDHVAACDAGRGRRAQPHAGPPRLATAAWPTTPPPRRASSCTRTRARAESRRRRP